MRLKDKVAIVTGAARGIGQEFALALVGEGAKLVCADLNDCGETLALIEDKGGSGISVEVDVSSAQSTQALATAAVEAYGSIDILVNNAGILAEMKPFEQIDENEWDLIMNVNAKGQFLCMQAVVPQMKKQQSGKIINIASSTFMEGVPNTVHYVASKGAVIGMTRSISRELRDTGIYVNVIAPGMTITKTIAGQLEGNDAAVAIREHVNASRIIARDQTPDDLIGPLLFLASNESDFMSGQTLLVDGGVSHI